MQFAVYQGKVFVLEVNPRASRTVPFIAKAVGLPLAGIAAQVMAGRSLREIGLTEQPRVPRFFVKVPVFPFNRFPGVDPQLGPEMKSTGEVMGIGETFGEAFAKGWLAANNRLPLSGTAFLTVHDRDKRALLPVALRLQQLGFRLVATDGTAAHLRAQGVPVETVLKLHQGRPHVVDHIKNGEVDLIVNTPLGGDATARTPISAAPRSPTAACITRCRSAGRGGGDRGAAQGRAVAGTAARAAAAGRPTRGCRRGRAATRAGEPRSDWSPGGAQPSDVSVRPGGSS